MVGTHIPYSWAFVETCVERRAATSRQRGGNWATACTKEIIVYTRAIHGAHSLSSTLSFSCSPIPGCFGQQSQQKQQFLRAAQQVYYMANIWNYGPRESGEKYAFSHISAIQQLQDNERMTSAQTILSTPAEQCCVECRTADLKRVCRFK